MPKISIIIPIYNVEKYLKKCLDSLIVQTLSDIEIICVNDGSTDSSLSILEEYCQKDSRIKIINQKNMGPGIARNTGITMATSEYIGFVDPDDWVDKNMFETMYKTARKRDADMVECDFYMCFEGSKRKKIRCLFHSLKTIWKIPIQLGVIYSWKNVKTSVFKGLRAMVWNRIYRRKMLMDNSILFPEGSGEDYPFSIDAVLSAKRIVHCGKILYKYLIRNNSLSNGGSVSLPFAIDHPKLLKQILDKHSLYEEFRTEYLNYCLNYYSNQFFVEEQKLLCSYKQYFSEKESINLLRHIEQKRKYRDNSFIESLFSVKTKIIDGKNVKQVILFNHEILI